MFRKCQIFRAESFNHIVVQQMTNKNDKLVVEEVAACKVKPLPDVSLFDLSSMIENGVDLRRVSVTIPSTSIDLEKMAAANARAKGLNKTTTKKEGE